MSSFLEIHLDNSLSIVHRAFFEHFMLSFVGNRFYNVEEDPHFIVHRATSQWPAFVFKIKKLIFIKNLVRNWGDVWGRCGFWSSSFFYGKTKVIHMCKEGQHVGDHSLLLVKPN
jgi:hypothetical protein